MATMSNEEIDEHFGRVAQAIARLELKLEYIDNPAGSIPPQLAQVYALLQQGKKLEAIKAYR